MTFSSKAQKLIVNYFAFTHLIIAAGAGVSAYVAGVALGEDEKFMGPSLFIALCTGFGYTVQRLLKLKVSPESMPAQRLEFLRANGVGILVVWGVGLAVGAWSLELAWGVTGVGVAAVIGVLGIGYAVVPKNWVKGLRALREVPGMKLPMLSVVWGAATVVLPWMLCGATDPSSELWWIVLARILYIAGLTIPFDLRDADLDHPSMKTLAQTLGPRTAILTAALLAILSSAIWMHLGMNWLSLHAILTAAIVFLTKKDAPEYFFCVILDGLLVVQLFGLS